MVPVLAVLNLCITVAVKICARVLGRNLNIWAWGTGLGYDGAEILHRHNDFALLSRLKVKEQMSVLESQVSIVLQDNWAPQKSDEHGQTAANFRPTTHYTYGPILPYQTWC